MRTTHFLKKIKLFFFFFFNFCQSKFSKVVWEIFLKNGVGSFWNPKKILEFELSSSDYFLEDKKVFQFISISMIINLLQEEIKDPQWKFLNYKIILEVSKSLIKMSELLNLMENFLQFKKQKKNFCFIFEQNFFTLAQERIFLLTIRLKSFFEKLQFKSSFADCP